MIHIKEIINSVFTSKTYILYKESDKKAWLVDIGDVEPVVAFANELQKSIEGVFLTHGHFDHIYGLEALVARFERCNVYCTDYCKEALGSEKVNLSRYHGTPIHYMPNNVVVVHDGGSLALFEGESRMEFFETPGHNPGCLTMVMGDVIFTGDAYIPGVGVNTQLPKADKELAQHSLARIMELSEGKTILSGHHV